jgi:hypothetical protein
LSGRNQRSRSMRSPPGFFGGVEASIGGLNQRLGALAPMSSCNLDRERDPAEMFSGRPLDDFSRSYGLAKVLGYNNGFMEIRVRKNDCKFLTVVTRGKILALGVLH